MRLIRTIILALLGVTFYGASGADEPDFLPVDQAFVLDARIVGDAIHFDWRIAEGYYLVRSRLAVVSDAGAVTLGKMVTPPGKIKQDPYFGAVQVYRGAVLIEVPVLSGEGELTVRATAQGCADAGLCYPPSTRTVSLTVPASVGSSEIHTALLATHSSAGSTEAGTALTQALGLNPSADAQTQDALPNSSLLADSGSGGALGALGQLSKVFGFGGDPKFLPADEAFELDHRLVGRYLELSWQIADGYYLYRDKVRVTVRPESGISPGPPQMAMGTAKSDEYFGTMQVFYDQAVARVALQGQPAAAQLDVNIRYQGCADAGLCYPPIDKQVSVAMPFNWGTPASDAGLGGSSTAIAGGESDNQRSTLAGLPASEQDVLENLLGTGGLWVVIGSFFAAGLLLSLTPCVFPMVPILSGIIVGEGQSCSRRRAFMLSFVYVQGMALTYTIAGVVAGMYHINAQAALQDPWVLSASVIVFVALALSMFGFYDIQVPGALQAKLAELSNKQRGGSLFGVGVMGVLSALIVGPCVAPPLVGALSFISNSGDAVLGGAALYAMAMGMGVPLLLIGASAGHVLPRAGAWMVAIKAAFGIALLAVAISFLGRGLVPDWVVMALWSALFVVSAIYIGAFDPIVEGVSGWRRLRKGVGLLSLVYGVLLMVGAANGNVDPLRPLRGLSTAATGGPQALDFQMVKGLEGVRSGVAIATRQRRPAMLDYYADWCISCKTMERNTFTDSEVVAALAGVQLLKTDVTDMDPRDKGLIDHYGLFGPPTIQFFASDGSEMKRFRLVGEVTTAQFLAHVQRFADAAAVAQPAGPTAKLALQTQ